MRYEFRKMVGLCLLMFIYFINPVLAQDQEYFLNSPTTQKYAIILGGAAANEKYKKRFQEWTFALHDSLVQDYAYPSSHVTLLLGKGESKDKKVSGACKRETIQETLDVLKKKVKPGDQLTFFIIGHGTSYGNVTKFNLVGPDITGYDLSDWLENFTAQDIIIVNTTSASYPFSKVLSAPGRVIVSATRSRAERYDTIFPHYFIEALTNHQGDRDKNTRVSVWEAFIYANRSVKKWYEDQQLLPSEHATLDDNGDGVFQVNPDPTRGDGQLAQIAYWDTLSKNKTFGIKNKNKIKLAHQLIAKMQTLERSVFLLRNHKADLLRQDYQQQMETLLIQLAQTTRQFRKLQPSKKRK